MTSGAWITFVLLFSLFGVFLPWEFIQLYRRRRGNKSARTMSQWVIMRAKEGSKFWTIFLLVFPIFFLLVMIWLIFHWQGLCFNFGWLCSVDV